MPPLKPVPTPQSTPSPTAAAGPAQALQVAEHQWNSRLLEDAQQSYRTFLERFPDYPNNHLVAVRLADILQEQRHHRDALEAYAKIIEGYPHSEGAVISQIRMAELGAQFPALIPSGRGESYASYYHPLSALAQLIQAYPLSPLADVARYKTGVIRLHREELQAALDTFRALLEKPLKDALRSDVEKEFHKTLERLLVHHQQQGAFLEVLRTFLTYKGWLAPTQVAHADLVLPVALSCARLGLLPEAEQLMQRLVDKAPTPQQRAPLALEQATILFQQGKLQAAKSLLVPLEQSAEVSLRRRSVLLSGRIALQEGRPAEAVRSLDFAAQLLDTPVDRAFVLALLGKAYVAQGDKPKGLQAFQQCAAITTEEASTPPSIAETCLFHAGGLLFEGQQLQPALATYQTLLQAFPQTSHRNWLLLRLAEIHQKLDDAPQWSSTLATLRDTASHPLWQKVATEAVDDRAWHKRFHELLAEFQNHLIR
jgi:tetratricopeptide (TPR) repeat protein